MDAGEQDEESNSRSFLSVSVPCAVQDLIRDGSVRFNSSLNRFESVRGPVRFGSVRVVVFIGSHRFGSDSVRFARFGSVRRPSWRELGGTREMGGLGRARVSPGSSGSPGGPGGIRESPGEPGGAWESLWSLGELGGAWVSQGEPGGARGSPGGPGEPGGARGS